jgi:hypothetical protein
MILQINTRAILSTKSCKIMDFVLDFTKALIFQPVFSLERIVDPQNKLDISFCVWIAIKIQIRSLFFVYCRESFNRVGFRVETTRFPVKRAKKKRFYDRGCVMRTVAWPWCSITNWPILILTCTTILVTSIL